MYVHFRTVAPNGKLVIFNKKLEIINTKLDVDGYHLLSMLTNTSLKHLFKTCCWITPMKLPQLTGNVY